MLRFTSGGARMEAEATRMVTEKVAAAVEIYTARPPVLRDHLRSLAAPYHRDPALHERFDNDALRLDAELYSV
jgi:hypothetical protein